MSIDLQKREAEKNLIDLSKKATISLEKKGLVGQRARVALALDISASMKLLYDRGIVQQVTEKLLGLAMNFDDNGAADVFLFGANDYTVGEIEQSNFFQFVDREILKSHSLESRTHYAGIMKRIAHYFYPKAIQVTEKRGFLGFGSKKEVVIDASSYSNDDPVYVLFITDGDNHDKEETTEVIKHLSRLGIFWQFVGVGNDTKAYLEKLDNMQGRFIDNANFFNVPDLTRISDSELYDQLLNEFPSWLKEAKQKSLCAK